MGHVDHYVQLADRWVCFFGEFLYLYCVNILYQGLLDMHSILRNPNQDRFIGHLCTQRFLKFTSDVSNNLINNISTAPQWERPQPGAPMGHSWGRVPAKASPIIPATTASKPMPARASRPSASRWRASRPSASGAHGVTSCRSSVTEVFEVDGGGEFI